ncbi:AAA family ATPase (plasmid) [Bradyrhizobium barranii subsp. apii]|uniref:AAA family ATPase n=1 Tax=Bradyrhizobium barranii subsp. apii TaxID=2819348 RepID=A0A8T5VSF9_9BRAD|nr:AAA family ATPase [Bradyrhizobium barranii]UPT92439.1 AAA family ATPase [Bradyrhizobium barranii subsp. apii]
MLEKIAGDRASPPAPRLGPLELAAYKADWREFHIYARHVAQAASKCDAAAGANDAPDGPAKVPAASLPQAGTGPSYVRRGFAALRRQLPDDGEGEFDHDDGADRDVAALTPGRIAARLLLARLFDRNPSVMRELRAGAPVVIVDIPDLALFDRVSHQWMEVLGLRDLLFADIGALSDRTKREDYGAVEAVTKEPLKKSNRGSADERAFVAVQLALPVIAITPSAETHLSAVLLDAATHRLMLPDIDGSLIDSVIRAVTGKPCRAALPEHVVAQVGVRELLLAVRFDRTPQQCVEKLLHFVASKTAKRGSRDLTLDELHGLDEAVEWARSTKRDLDAWRRGEIGWDEIDAGVVLDGPPGTGKTTFAKVASAAMGLPLITATYAKWQAAGHLGDFLREMKKDFGDARSKEPAAIMFIDELDSFPVRDGSTNDYVVACVNAIIEQLDGLQGATNGAASSGRQKVIFIAATNDVRRCDPAIVRAGRLNRIIQVGLPAPSDIEKMMRVRLRGDLGDEPLEDLSLLAVGSTGADIERIVKDARRQARQERRPLSIEDMRRAVLGNSEGLSPEVLTRASFHEAGHIVLAVLHGGPADIHAVVAGSRRSVGFVVSKHRHAAGTLEDYRREMQGLLAGRAAEEIELGAAGDGSGGSEGSSDLAQATRIAAALVGSFGHSGPHPLLFLADRSRTRDIMSHAYLRSAAHQELAAAFDEAKRVLIEHRAALQSVAAHLRERGRIDGHEVERILAETTKTP